MPHTHDLRLIPTNNTQSINMRLPLFGHFCCRLAVRPDFLNAPYIINKLQFIYKNDSFNGFARLQAFKIDMFESSELANNIDANPNHSIEITRDTKLKIINDTEFYVQNMEEGIINDYIFKTESIDDTNQWKLLIKRAINEHMKWNHVAITSPMRLSVPGNTTNKYFNNRSPRQGSLYDQVPVLGKLFFVFVYFLCKLIHLLFFDLNIQIRWEINSLVDHHYKI